MKIVEKTFPKETLCLKAFDLIDYSDTFCIYSDKEFNNVDEFASAYFLSQPFWLRLISQNSFSKVKIQKQILSNNFITGSTIGSWKVFDRNELEIVFGENLGFMSYRFALSILNEIPTVVTVVRFQSKLAKYYFNIVKILHTKFIKISLNNIEKH